VTKRLAIAAALGFIGGVVTMAQVLDRLLGGQGIRIRVRHEHPTLDDEPGGGWQS